MSATLPALTCCWNAVNEIASRLGAVDSCDEITRLKASSTSTQIQMRPRRAVGQRRGGGGFGSGPPSPRQRGGCSGGAGLRDGSVGFGTRASDRSRGVQGTSRFHPGGG